MSQQEIVIVCPGAKSPFVLNDAATLATAYPTEILGVDTLPFPRKLVLLWRLLVKFITQNVRLIVLYFSVPAYAPFAALLAKAFGAKIVIITGGYDMTYVPVIDWGEMKTWWKRIAQRFTLSLVDTVLAFSEFSKGDALKYGNPKRIRALHFGIDSEYFKPGKPKEPLAITVCFELNSSTYVQKGLRTMIEAARLVPEAQFVLIGPVKSDPVMDEARATAPPNVVFHDRFTSGEELLQFYQRARVYLQVSAHEGFGIANAEAMSCECIPVVTDTTALPEVVGDCGFFVPFNDVAATAEAVRSALRSPQLGPQARRRIAQHFTLERRESELMAEVDTLLGRRA